MGKPYLLENTMDLTLEWVDLSYGYSAPEHECFIAPHPACLNKDARYIITRPTDGKAYVALYEAMHACTEGAVCLDFRQEVAPHSCTTLERAQKACQFHVSSGDWPPHG